MRERSALTGLPRSCFARTQTWQQAGKYVSALASELPSANGQLPDGTSLPLFRLRYSGSASTWGFAVYRASHDDYEDSILPSGWPAGTPQEALDCACGLYLGDTTAWLSQPPTN